MGTQGLLLSNPAGALSLSHAHFPLSAASALRPRLLTSQPHRCHRLGETAAILKLSRKWHCLLLVGGSGTGMLFQGN